jgi:signal transduction histidine kinase
MGLGLSICRSIVEARGGQLWASEDVPCGALFQFTLPTSQGIMDFEASTQKAPPGQS